MLNAMTRAFRCLTARADQQGANTGNASRTSRLVHTRQTVDTSESAPTSIGQLRSLLPHTMQNVQTNDKFMVLAERYLLNKIQDGLAAIDRGSSDPRVQERAIATARDKEIYRSASNAILQDFVEGQAKRFDLYTRYRNGFIGNGRFKCIGDLKAAFITSTYKAFIRACEDLDQLTPPPPYHSLLPPAPSYEEVIHTILPVFSQEVTHSPHTDPVTQ